MAAIMFKLFFNLAHDLFEVVNLLLLALTARFDGIFVVTLFALHEDDRLEGLRGRKVLFFSVDELELFFGETSWTVVFLSIVLLTSIGVLVDFLHGNYSNLKIKPIYALDKSSTKILVTDSPESMSLNNLLSDQAVSWQAPPTALIFLSAILLKNLALITTGWEGKNPFPRTLKNPAFVTSMTGTLSLFSA